MRAKQMTGRTLTAAALVVMGMLGCHAEAGKADSELEERLSSVELVEAFPNLSFQRSLFLTVPPDDPGRVFVVEQGGRIFTFENRADITEDDMTVALDIREKTRSIVNRDNRGHNEEGLYGLAFHPDFAENRQVIIHYAASNPQRGVVSRLTMNETGTQIDPDSEEVLLEIEQPAGNHNGGMIAFGPDGYLYIGLGDGGGAGDPYDHGQNLETLLATILRIDVDRTEGDLAYAIPEDNPFVDHDTARPEIYAYGLRNPWRFSFDRETGDIWVGDVCQNAWEKIFLIQKGSNHGWPYLEGSHPYDGIPEGMSKDDFVLPIAEHNHPRTQSITGGYVYRGSDVPELEGLFVYGDYVTGVVFALQYDGETGEVRGPVEFENKPEIASFGEDADGELYVLSLEGRIYRFASVAGE